MEEGFLTRAVESGRHARALLARGCRHPACRAILQCEIMEAGAVREWMRVAEPASLTISVIFCPSAPFLGRPGRRTRHRAPGGNARLRFIARAELWLFARLWLSGLEPISLLYLGHLVQ